MTQPSDDAPGGPGNAMPADKPIAYRRMTPEMLLEICKDRSMWSQPQLNTQLYLNMKGFDTMEGLEEYINVKALNADNNNITAIECLGRMSELRSLHLASNRIQQIDGLGGNPQLRQLNLSGNALTRISGLNHLMHLEILNVSGNAIARLEDLHDLREMPALSNFDVSKNQIEVTEGVVEFWSEFADRFKVLRYFGNPGERSIEHYRKRLVNSLPIMTYLDDRPVFPVERKACAAWAEGGLEAMHAAKRSFHKARFESERLDPERGAFLTRMRRLAIERIEREERERQALPAPVPPSDDVIEASKRMNSEPENPAETVAAGAEPMEPIENPSDQKVDKEPAAMIEGQAKGSGEFRPPPRVLASWAIARKRAPGPADFRSVHSPVAPGQKLEDRQSAAIGDDIWAGTDWKPASEETKRRAGVSEAKAVAGATEVMPLLWERQAGSTAAEERRCLDHSLESIDGGSRQSDSLADGASRPDAAPHNATAVSPNELAMLD